MFSAVLTIGEKLREIRTRKNLSLDEAARLTEVSKPMLGQIERGQSTPTITTLWKIATGLKTPISSFLEDRQVGYTVVTVGEMEAISEADGKMRAFPVFTYDPLRSVETFFIEFAPGCSHCSEKHDDGVEEHVFVMTGKLQIVMNGVEIVVGERQAVRFYADVPHSYNNPFEGVCTIYNTIFYPNYERGKQECMS